MSSIKPSALTAGRLRELLDYDPATGIFRWRNNRPPRMKAGDIAGSPDPKGYVIIMIDKRPFKAHRLAWFYVHGIWPDGDLDHEDTIKNHNWINNLRPATRSQNQGNARRRSTNTSGYKGVSFYWKSQKWRAVIKHDGKYHHIGHYATAAEAHTAYVAKAAELFGEFANDGG